MSQYTPKEGYGQVLYAGILDTRKVVRLDEHRVLKSGVSMDQRETDAMKFIATNTTIPVPKIYESKFVSPDKYTSEYSHIIMEYMPGETLEKAWPTLSEDDRVSICQQLGGYLIQLQNLKGKRRIEGVNGACVTVGLRFPRRGGPFETEAEFNEFLVNGLHKKVSTVLKQYARAALFDTHDIHFAHGDFTPRNILVDGGKVTAILDWEKAGWFPEYWDISRMVSEPKVLGMLDYQDYFNHIFSRMYVQEFLAMRFIEGMTVGS
ncbi:hypothetical protein FQN52_004799 [Onygenales sp. PD_12]|nr:hypothetical protein FQN52_004799 [Onygenales sp. PD_12]KAK2785564.1 hypothetical protein FQN53_007649 [Emmonsiellopsis sp. PD_33]KAK2806268.1 hypothetical protein FQN51_007309 [Onygenales sp. PD_10]